MKKLYLLAAALCLLLCQPQQAQAEILTYEGVGEYYRWRWWSRPA